MMPNDVDFSSSFVQQCKGAGHDYCLELNSDQNFVCANTCCGFHMSF